MSLRILRCLHILSAYSVGIFYERQLVKEVLHVNILLWKVLVGSVVDCFMVEIMVYSAEQE